MNVFNVHLENIVLIIILVFKTAQLAIIVKVVSMLLHKPQYARLETIVQQVARFLRCVHQELFKALLERFFALSVHMDFTVNLQD